MPRSLEDSDAIPLGLVTHIALANGARLRAATQTVVSPTISGAKRASNAVSLVVVGVADGELIVGIGVDRDVCVDPYRQAAAKLQHIGLTLQRRDVLPRKDGVGVSPPQSRQRLALRYGCQT